MHSLENKIEELKADNCDYNDRCSKLQMENSGLIEKLQEIEELNHEYERSFKLTIESEKVRYSDYIAKLNSKHSEEKDTLLTQLVVKKVILAILLIFPEFRLNKNEIELVKLKEDISKYIRQINELNILRKKEKKKLDFSHLNLKKRVPLNPLSRSAKFQILSILSETQIIKILANTQNKD